MKARSVITILPWIVWQAMCSFGVVRREIARETEFEYPRTRLPAVLVRINGFLIPQLENVPCAVTEMDILIHHLVQLLDALDLIVFNDVRQASEDVITVLHCIHSSNPILPFDISVC